MRVLVACEFSGIVRDAFRALGHDATSCDLLPSERPGPHIEGDVLEVLGDGWDLIVAHPPCTYLANSGASRLYVGGRGSRIPNEQRWQRMREGAAFFRACLDAPATRVAVENPVMLGHAGLPKPTQTIQPWQFGHPESKTTCLWLRGLPPLIPTNVLPRPASGHWENQTPSGQNRLGPSPTRWMERSRTYEGFAQAMAQQWGATSTPEEDGDLTLWLNP